MSIGIDPTSQDATIHPSKFCHCCHVKLTSASKISPMKWVPNSDIKKVLLVARHCYSHTLSLLQLQHHISLSQIADKRCVAKVTGCSCNGALNGPLELLPCKTLMCSSCCTSLAVSASFNCPSCLYQHDASIDKFTALVEKMINEMSVYVKNVAIW